MRKPPMPNAGGGSQLKGQLHTMIGEGNSISHQVSRPVTNHKHYQGDIIKTSNLQINPFSDEIIAQLKHSENLIVSEEVAIAPFSSSSDEGNSPVNQHPLELEEFQEGMIMPLDKIKQDRQSKSKNPFSQQKLSIAMLQNTPVKSNYQNDEVPVVEMLPLIQKQQSDVRQYLRCRASNKRVKPMISHNPESNAKTYQYNIPSQSPSPEPRQTLLSTQKMQNLMFLDASQIIKDAGGQRRISPRISDVDYYNPSGSTVVINQEGVGNNSKGSIACIISGGESSQQFTTQQIQDGNQQKYAQQTKHGSFSRKLPQSIQLNKLLSTQTFNETTKYAFQKESFQSKDPSFGKSCLQETIGNSDSQQPPQQQIIQNFNTICNIYIFNNGDCNNQKLTRGSEEHLSHPGADEKIFGHLPGALGSNQRNNLYSNTLNGNISQNGRQQSTGRQKVMWLNQQSKQNSLGGAARYHCKAKGKRSRSQLRI
ncbi:hypothetical protein FGO68_gene14277 [Halteria grandinella]|uniref:Uncharacterized protein n=1 Tax=Halteria grandinella TaxID=5974 RepID=A0A8J8NX47_HALGN|nr:hypothetical protein FGO68_gene14277 [Halteria grandinella]